MLTMPTTFFRNVYSENDITEGLIHYWPFDEGTGSTVASRGSLGQVATLAGTPLPAFVTGQRGPFALDFNENTDAILGSHLTAGTSTPPNDISIVLWANFDTITSSDMRLMGWFNPAPVFQLQLFVSDNFLVFTDVNVSTFTTNSSNTLFTIGQYFHIAVTQSVGFAAKMYINGVSIPVDTGPTGTPAGRVSAPLRIGVHEAPGSVTSEMDGRLDDIRVYDRIITPAEVLFLFNH